MLQVLTVQLAISFPLSCCSGGGAGGKKKGGKSRLANMWSKAPAVKEKPQQPARSKPQAAPAVDADAALRSAQQVLLVVPFLFPPVPAQQQQGAVEMLTELSDLERDVLHSLPLIERPFFEQPSSTEVM